MNTRRTFGGLYRGRAAYGMVVVVFKRWTVNCMLSYRTSSWDSWQGYATGCEAGKQLQPQCDALPALVLPCDGGVNVD